MLLKIFYLDDEKDLLEIFSDQFSGPEVIINTFHEPESMIQAIKISPPDLLVLDYRLGKTTGDRVAQLVDPSIPKLLITGELSIQTNVDFLKIIKKPLSIEEVNEIIFSIKKSKVA